MRLTITGNTLSANPLSVVFCFPIPLSEARCGHLSRLLTRAAVSRCNANSKALKLQSTASWIMGVFGLMEEVALWIHRIQEPHFH